MARQISDIALIGDCETAALVDRSGSIDGLCWPRFDFPGVPRSTARRRSNDSWKIAPTTEPIRTSRRYLPDTLILETRFQAATGSARLLDFMPLRRRASVRPTTLAQT